MLVNPREEKAGFDSEAGALIRSEISTVKSGDDLVLLKSEDRGLYLDGPPRYIKGCQSMFGDQF